MPAVFVVTGVTAVRCFCSTVLLALTAMRHEQAALHHARCKLGRVITAGILAVLSVLSAPQLAHAQPSFTVSEQQLQQALAQRFPIRYQVPGLLDFDVQTPQLRLLQAQNRVRAQMSITAAGPALRHARQGTFDVDFALRYEPSDRTIRAHQLHLRNLRFPDLTPQASDLLSSYGTAIAAEALQEVVLHQLQPQDLAIPDSMGMRPDSITVTDKGLVIGFVLKPL